MAAPLLVFDLDGTLADTAGDLVATLNHILAREGLAPLTLEAARNMVGMGARSLIRQGFEASGRALEADRLEALFVDYLAWYEDHIAVHTRLFPGVVESLDRFEGAGWRFAVCTNKAAVPSVKLLEALGVANRFAAICGQDTFAWSKPDARALLSTIEKAGGRAEAAIMVGDSRTDIATAKNAAIPVVAVDFGYTDVHVSQLSPDRVISHFDALWEAVSALRA
jgi:phosphoglycolate phosphatase